MANPAGLMCASTHFGEETMKKRTLIFVAVCCLALTIFSKVQAQTSGSLVADAKPGWAAISSNIVKAAEKMPEEDYSFRPATRSEERRVGKQCRRREWTSQ